MFESAARKTYWKKCLLVSVCFLGAITLLSNEPGRGFLDPRALGISLLISIAATVVAFLLIYREYGKDYRAALPPPGTPLDEATRKRRLRYIRNGKIVIGFLAAGLVLGSAQFSVSGGPVWAFLVGALVNLSIIALILKMIARLKKSLD